MLTNTQLTDLLDQCLVYADDNQIVSRHEHLKAPIANLRTWGRDSYFCINVINKKNLGQLIELYDKLDPVKDEELVISLLATLSNIMLANREIKVLVLQFDLNNLIDRTLILTNFSNAKHTYENNLVSVILPQIRLIYLVVVDKTLVSVLTDEILQRIVKLLETQLKLVSEGDIVANTLVMVDLIKIGYAILNHNKKYYTEKTIDISLNRIVNNNLPSVILNQYANYISFLPIESLKSYRDQLIKITELYVKALEGHVEDGDKHHAISVLNFFNHLALLSESLYCDDDHHLFETLRSQFIPNDNTPVIYTKLMKALLSNGSSTLFSFAGDHEQMLKNLTLDFYFKIMGNNIDLFVNEMGILLSMDFVKAKLGHNTKTFAQGEFDIAKNNTSVYPLHYNVVEENKKLQESLSELTEEEKEEELEKLVEIFDKMKKNGMIKMVDNPMDAMQ